MSHIMVMCHRLSKVLARKKNVTASCRVRKPTDAETWWSGSSGLGGWQAETHQQSAVTSIWEVKAGSRSWRYSSGEPLRCEVLRLCKDDVRPAGFARAWGRAGCSGNVKLEEDLEGVSPAVGTEVGKLSHDRSGNENRQLLEMRALSPDHVLSRALKLPSRDSFGVLWQRLCMIQIRVKVFDGALFGTEYTQLECSARHCSVTLVSSTLLVQPVTWCVTMKRPFIKLQASSTAIIPIHSKSLKHECTV
jgi:hypothetical protein